MKYSEATEEIRKRNSIQIENQRKALFELSKGACSKLLNYLFALNTGSLAATLAFYTTKDKSGFLKLSIVFFCCGIFALLVHAAWDYYKSRSEYKRFSNLVIDYYEDRVVWGDLPDQKKVRGRGNWVGHIFGWSSGVFFLGGMIVNVIGFLS